MQLLSYEQHFVLEVILYLQGVHISFQMLIDLLSEHPLLLLQSYLLQARIRLEAHQNLLLRLLRLARTNQIDQHVLQHDQFDLHVEALD
ncbi:hypothetical protein D9M71_726070 [compost metagenome]